MVFRKRRRDTEDAFALYYASDVHGSDQCWRKFLGASKFYSVGPLARDGRRPHGQGDRPDRAPGADGSALYGVPRREEQRVPHAPRSSRSCWLPCATTACTPGSPLGEGDLACTGPTRSAQDELFETVMLAELQAVDRPRGRAHVKSRGVDVFVMAGNDDPWSCDSDPRGLLAHVHGRAMMAGGGASWGLHEMISCFVRQRDAVGQVRASSTKTRCMPVSSLLADRVERPREAPSSTCTCRPTTAGLYRAREIRARPHVSSYKSGQANEIPVGSRGRPSDHRGVPAVALAARAHPRVPRRGLTSAGRCAFNSGSEYATGRYPRCHREALGRRRTEPSVHHRIEGETDMADQPISPESASVTDSGLFVRNAHDSGRVAYEPRVGHACRLGTDRLVRHIRLSLYPMVN